jgi:alpha-beta hydrolase superfamily lysophospholipase
METTVSKDGTTIAFDRLGDGPPVVLVCGFPTDRKYPNGPLASLLASGFTVLNYDRRGRGDSGDTQPYAVEREFEDLDAVIGEAGAGGSAFVYGTSSGAALALKAAAHGVPITKLALWEPPYIVDDTRERPPADYKVQVAAMLAADRRGDVIEFFFTTIVGIPPEFVAQMRQSPYWSAQEALAHTLLYEADVMGDYSFPADRVRSVAVPSLVLDGGTTPWITNSAETVAKGLPNARRRTLEGQTHDVSAEALAPALTEFFTG